MDESDTDTPLTLDRIKESDEILDSRPKLKDLHNLITPEYAAHWKVIGTSLGFETGYLDAIESGYPKNTFWCCNTLFQKWLERDTTAKKIIQIIHSPAVTALTANTTGPVDSRQEKPCTFNVHTMKHQAAMSSEVCQVEIHSRPNRITVDMVMMKVLEKLRLPIDEAKKCFSLWLTSPQLQLQMKFDHHPCLFYYQWKQLLVLYTDCNYDTIKMDKPIISFQRNAFLKREDELNIIDPQIVELLYEEAKLNVLRGQYPMEMKDIVELAGMQATIEQTFNENTCTELYYKNHLIHYFPYHMVKKTRGIILPKLRPPFVPTLEEQLMAAHRDVSSRNIGNFSLKQDYLKKCREMSHYGSVLFSGQIQRKTAGYIDHTLFGSNDRLISVAINTIGLHVIRRATPPELLLSLPFREISWLYKECNETGEEFFSVLILEFDFDENPHEKVTKRLKIFSRQAPMMDNMIQRITTDLNYCEHKRQQDRLDGDEVDFAEQPSPGEPFQCRIVGHMLVCDVKLPDGTWTTVSKPVKSNGSSRRTGDDNVEMKNLPPPNQ